MPGAEIGDDSREPFSRSLQKRIEAQTGEKSFTAAQVAEQVRASAQAEHEACCLSCAHIQETRPDDFCSMYPHEESKYLARAIAAAVEKATGDLRARADKLNLDLHDITEYWNGSHTDGAMSNALEHILDVGCAAINAYEAASPAPAPITRDSEQCAACGTGLEEGACLNPACTKYRKAVLCTCTNNGDLCPACAGIEENLEVKRTTIALAKMVSAAPARMLACLPDKDGVNRIDEARSFAGYILEHTPPITREDERSKGSADYPRPCGLCPGMINSADDLDWHGLGNCVDICEHCGGSGQEPGQEPSNRPAKPTADEGQQGKVEGR